MKLVTGLAQLPGPVVIPMGTAAAQCGESGRITHDSLRSPVPQRNRHPPRPSS